MGSSLGQEPTVSVGIVSAKRNDRLQTDASLNPGNSGGPLLNMFGEAIGVVTSRVDSTDSGRAVTGIAFAIPINEVKSSLGRQVSPSGSTLPTPTPTPFPVIGPTPDVEATRSAIQTVDAHRRKAEQATRTAIEAKQEAERYAASLEATRIAELPTPTPTVPPTPTPTPTPEPTPTPLPTPTPHPATYCEEWEALVLEWIKQGNNYSWFDSGVPDHPYLTAKDAGELCLTAFPKGFYPEVDGAWVRVGYGPGELLPGTYEYRREGGDKRVEAQGCSLILNDVSLDWEGDRVEMPYGEPFTIRLFTYHGNIYFVSWLCEGKFYRIGD